MARTKKVTKTQAKAVLNAVAVWMGKHGGMTADGSPAPTGSEAAGSGLGPNLVMDWDWTGKPTPTILLEGGPEDWAIRVGDGNDEEFRKTLNALGVWTEPYSSYALSIYPLEN